LIIGALSELNSAGKPLGRLISNSLCLVNIFEELRTFFANLEVYGSINVESTLCYQPSTVRYSNRSQEQIYQSSHDNLSESSLAKGDQIEE